MYFISSHICLINHLSYFIPIDHLHLFRLIIQTTDLIIYNHRKKKIHSLLDLLLLPNNKQTRQNTIVDISRKMTSGNLLQCAFLEKKQVFTLVLDRKRKFDRATPKKLSDMVYLSTIFFCYLSQLSLQDKQKYSFKCYDINFFK